MSSRFYLFTISILLLSFSNVYSQDESYFSAGINYVNNNVYLGRKDSVLIPYISPYIEYHNKTGIYGNMMASFLPAIVNGRSPHFDLLSAEVGYMHDFLNDHLSTMVYFDKFWYSQYSSSVKSSIKGSGNLYLLYRNNILEPGVMTAANIIKSDKTDYIVAPFIDHDFTLIDEKLDIMPTITMNGGTQHYYNQYKVRKTTDKKGKKVTSTQTLTSGSSSTFQVLDYEFSLQIQYEVRHWLIRCSPTYVVPESPAVVNVTNLKGVTTSHPEKISNSFFIELDFCHKGYFKNGKAVE